MDWTRREDDPGVHAIEFIERRLTHTKGKWAGVRFILADWQRERIIRPLFGTLREDGTRQYRTCYIEIPRKNGKSETAAAVALKLLFADGEPGAEIFGAAADKQQASIVFDVARQMVEASPALAKRAKVYRAKTIHIPGTESVYRVLSADAFTKHGLNAHGVIFDELHAQPNRELWDVLTTSTGARQQPLVFAITTAGYDHHSICGEIHDYADKLLRGVIEDPSFMAVIYGAPEGADWTDERVWRLANPALGDFRNIDEMREMAGRARQIPALQNTFRRLYLNQWTRQETRWMDLAAWDASAGLLREHELAKRSCFAGLDLADTTDIAALVLVVPMDDGTFRALPHFWVPAENVAERVKRDRVPYDVWIREGLMTATPGNVIDYSSIRARLKALGGQYRVRELAYDRWGATQLAQEFQEDGLTVVPTGQGYASMSAPTKELMNLVLGKRLVHGGHPVLRWMADNMVVKTDPAGNIKPDKAKSTEKIDGMVALIMALDRAIRNPVRQSVYDTRGMVSTA